jgi:hypothetical protein
VVHRGSNSIYPVAFGSILDGALDEVFDHLRMNGVYLTRIVGDTFDGGVVELYLMRYAQTFVYTIPLLQEYKVLPEESARCPRIDEIELTVSPPWTSLRVRQSFQDPWKSLDNENFD